MFKKIKNFFANLFAKKKEEEVKQEESVQEKEVVIEPEVKEEAEAVKEQKFFDFTEDDKENILNLLRPMVKNFNSDDMYKMVCEKVLESKTLKTYSSISEDRKVLTIKLTQSKLFNEKIADFIADHVVNVFKSNIDAEFMGKYEIESCDGEIVIRKIG